MKALATPVLDFKSLTMLLSLTAVWGDRFSLPKSHFKTFRHYPQLFSE